ncbi:MULTISPECIES: hypothetical protein [unclassified Candidatus Frackibacter]|uniref:hypothetical protein n=1 Tax=unclassified Candidatus Frackibacter TaxID=2648818 RepID=UPI000795CADA|nr:MULTISPECIES: hypothetical protein [unclassified Candidatus Frackibacter]KXS42355.1 MAG: hypothetical protein AWU54_1354 [Candidatus Frackibacter sp. T328-2]SDC68529.1 hypothetical protein SAMN04515661_11932 [Candidatus Frackibacter sp. WG11]SEM83144.1 hypothetical protein SAMN04488698_11931 [Candidatus Frackibacter sp. WG12]SFL92131.1 hypothetical protein SAMN04488699_12032 [Candidatus Frackibacter sp. WG13]
MSLSILQVFLGTFPESILMTYVGLGILGIKSTLKNYLKIGICYNIILVLARNLYGLHSIILCMVLSILIKIIINIDWKLSIMSAIIGFIIMFMGEALVLPVAFQYLNVNIQEVHKSLSLYFGLFYLSKVPLLISALSIYFLEFNIKGMLNDEEINI